MLRLDTSIKSVVSFQALVALRHPVLVVFEGLFVLVFLFAGVVDCGGVLVEIFDHAVCSVLGHLGRMAMSMAVSMEGQETAGC